MGEEKIIEEEIDVLQINLKDLNTVIDDVLNTHRKNSSIEHVSKYSGHTRISESDKYGGVQGEYNEYSHIYSSKLLPDNVFIKKTVATDSYGDGENLTKIEFVKPRSKTIIVYE